MIRMVAALLSLAWLALAVTGAGLAVAAIHGLWSQRGRPAGEFAGRVRAGSCAALRQYGAWWLVCAATCLVLSLAVHAAT